MVAIKAQQAAAFLKSPDVKLCAFLIFGNDVGQVAERAQALARALAARSSPPGEIIRLDEADLDGDPDRLAVELQTIPMFGDRKIVRANAGRRISTATLKPLVESGGLAGTLVVEAGNLKPDDALRTLFERSPHAAAVACYADEVRDLEGLVREVLQPFRLDIAPEARELLVSRLGADRALSRNEVEKLALYARAKSRIELEDVEAIVGDAAELALDRVVMAAASGQARRAVVECDRAAASGEGPQSIALALQRHVQRLHRARAALDAGRSFDDVARAMRPPLHFKARPAFEAQCRMWSMARLNAAQRLIAVGVRSARLSSALEAAITEQLLLDVAALAKGTEGAVARSGRG